MTTSAARQESAQPEPQGRDVPDRVDVRLGDREDECRRKHREADRSSRPVAPPRGGGERGDEGEQQHEPERAELQEEADERVLRQPALEGPVAVDEDSSFRPEAIAEQRSIGALADRAPPRLETATRVEKAPRASRAVRAEL